MFYRIIKGDRFISAIIIFLIAIVIWAPTFLSLEKVETPGEITGMPFYVFISNLLNDSLLLSHLSTFLLMLFAAFLLVRINARYILIQQKTFLPALFFIIITSFSPELHIWNECLPATLFVIFFLDIIFGSYNDEPNTYKIFEAGILLGLGSLFYLPLVYLLPFIWIAGMVQRPFSWREFIFPILGLLLPYIFVFAILFFTEKSIPDFLILMKDQFIFSFDFPHFGWVYLAFLIFLLLLIMMASVYLLKVYQFRKIYIRDYFMVLFWLFISALLIYFLTSGFNTGAAYLIAIPVSYILTNYFINAKKSLGNKILLYTLLGLSFFLAVSNFFEL